MAEKTVQTNWGHVRVGDLMYRGRVVKVGPILPTRSGRELMTVTYLSGESVIKEPDQFCTVVRES